MKIGTKSVLYGAHCFLLHPWFVAAAWVKLYGWPWDPRIWLAFFVHDLGYWGKPNMDGPEGETHVELGAKIMHWFDGWETINAHISLWEKDYFELDYPEWECTEVLDGEYVFSKKVKSTKWRDFSLFHSRYYAKKHGAAPSKLCFADKLAFSLTPRWLYLPMVRATGEINEYMKQASSKNEKGWIPVYDQVQWHSQLSAYMQKWVAEHIDGRKDTWTDGDRNKDERLKTKDEGENMKDEQCECGASVEFDEGAVMDEGGCWICSMCQADQVDTAIKKEIKDSLQQEICYKSHKVCRYKCPGTCKESC